MAELTSVTAIENFFIKFLSKSNMKIDKISNGPVYQMDERFQNLLIFGILIIFHIKNKI